MSLRITGALSLLLALGCGGAAPQELIDARAARDRAAHGPAAELNPAGLHAADIALAVAEKTYEEDGSGDKARDRGYVALRKIERAEALARIRKLDHDTEISEREARIKEIQLRVRARKELDRAKRQLGAPAPSGSPAP